MLVCFLRFSLKTMLKCNRLTCSKGRGVMLNLGNAKCCICWQEGPVITFLILAPCNTTNLQIIICQRGMGGVMALVHELTHYGDSLSVQLWAKMWLSQLWHSMLWHQVCWAMWTVMFSVRNNTYIICVCWGVGVGCGPSLSLSPLQLSLQRNDSLSRRHREGYNHSLHWCFLFMHIHTVYQMRIGVGWWGHNLQSVLIKYSKAPLAELRLLSEDDHGMTYRCLPCEGTVELLQVCHTCSLILSALVV